MNKHYDLEERTSVFGVSIIHFCKGIQYNVISNEIVKQLVRSGTSIGANYAEANSASSKKDFRNKIYICKKECQETKHWLRMITASNESTKSNARGLWCEVSELTLIFGKILSSLR